MNNYFTIIKALFKNKLRFDESKTKGKKLGISISIFLVYALFMTGAIMLIVTLGDYILSSRVVAQMVYFFILLTAAVVVLIFGIVNLVSVLYLSKDTDFYSILPVGATTVFFAKLSYVYLFETALVLAIALPTLLAFGIVAQMWAWYYVITFVALFVVPALPLVLSVILAIPVMYIASKVKNRNVISLIFFLLLFGGCFGLYIYFIFASSFGDISPDALMKAAEAINKVLYAFYPYNVLANAACGLPMFGLGIGASAAVGMAVFFGISAALLAIVWFLSKLMYSRSVKANNQTNESKAKKSEFKTSTSKFALIKREYISSLRTTQTAFQCYAVMLLPIIIAVMFGLVSKRSSGVGQFFTPIACGTLCAMFATLGNAAGTTFSREGNAMASLKILPVGIKTILGAKLTAWLILVIPVSIITVVVYNAINFVVEDFWLSFYSLVPTAIVFTVFSALWDLTAPKLKWTDPMQAIKHNTHLLGAQMMMMGCGLVVMVLGMILPVAGVSTSAVYIISWVLLYTVFAVFTVVDILMYRKIDKYYDRIEI